MTTEYLPNQNSPLSVVSKPEKDSNGFLKTHGFGFYEIQHRRAKMEDALAWACYEDELDGLSKEAIAWRLWTAYQNINRDFFANNKLDHHSGSTASTTIISDEHLITATLGDAAAFLVVYKNDKVCSVERINRRVHKPTVVEEKNRVVNAGGYVQGKYVCSSLAVSRAIGDKNLAKGIIIPDADIEIIDIAPYLAEGYKVQVITCCDGFTDAALSQTKESHEKYLKSCLSSMAKGLTEKDIAENLVRYAKDSSNDNITVAVQTINTKGKPQFKGMLGVYDGHGGTSAAHYIASNINNELKKQFKLTPEDYLDQLTSVYHKSQPFHRDNNETCRLTIEERQRYNAQLKNKIFFEKVRNEYTNKDRFHLFKAKKEGSSLQGDALKAAIILSLAEKIYECKDEEELNSTKAALQKDDPDYKILTTPQGLLGSILKLLFGVPTTSEWAFEKICFDRREELSLLGNK